MLAGVGGDDECNRGATCGNVDSTWHVSRVAGRHVRLGQAGQDAAARGRRERLEDLVNRRIKTQTVLPSAETAAMLFWALLASGQVVLRKVDGWTSIAQPLAEPIDLAA
jgi:hypothetical protein